MSEHRRPVSSVEGYVFIITYGRSGSTLLQNMLNAIPGYQIRGENNNALFYLAKAWSAINTSGPMRGARISGQQTDTTHPWYGAEHIQPDEFGGALADTFVRSILKPDADTRVSGFKEIRFHSHPEFFSRYLNFIHAYFPNSRFVFNTRDHGAVAKSGWWVKKDPAEVSRILSGAEKLFTAYQDRFPDRCHSMQYDTYTKDVHAFEPLFDFLSEPFDLKTAQDVIGTRLDHARGQGMAQ